MGRKKGKEKAKRNIPRNLILNDILRILLQYPKCVVEHWINVCWWNEIEEVDFLHWKLFLPACLRARRHSVRARVCMCVGVWVAGRSGRRYVSWRVHHNVFVSFWHCVLTVAIIFATVRVTAAVWMLFCMRQSIGYSIYPEHSGMEKRRKICSGEEKGKQSRKYHHPVRVASGKTFDRMLYIYSDFIYSSMRCIEHIYIYTQTVVHWRATMHVLWLCCCKCAEPFVRCT